MATFLIAAVEGDITGRLDDLVRACGKRPVGPIRFFKDWITLASRGRPLPWYQKENVVFACFTGRWTILSDDSFVGNVTDLIFRDEQLGLALFRHFGSPVVSALGNDTCCMYGFRLYRDNPRYVLVHEAVELNVGEPIPGEPPVIFEHYNEEDVLQVLKLLGIDIEEGMQGRSALVQFEDKPA
jgi:hypothetical protein